MKKISKKLNSLGKDLVETIEENLPYHDSINIPLPESITLTVAKTKEAKEYYYNLGFIGEIEAGILVLFHSCIREYNTYEYIKTEKKITPFIIGDMFLEHITQPLRQEETEEALTA